MKSIFTPLFLYLKSLFIWKCFMAYFSPLLIHLKNLFQLSFQDLAAVGSLLITGTAAGISYMLDLNYFGVSNLLILFVLLTILGNTVFGILKSRKKAAIALAEAMKLKSGPEYRLKMKLVKRYDFDINKLFFVLFKVLTFLSYLKIAQTFLNEGNGFIDWTSAILIQMPIALMWYKEWKSIGENSEFLWEKKAGIFEVTEFIFEVKFFSQYFKKDETPIS